MAAQLAQIALQKDPNNTRARDVLVDAALKSKDRSLLERARTLTESALASDPTSEQLLLSRARVLVSMELPQAAIPELETYCQTKEGSTSVPALVTLADLYRLAGDMDRAKQKIEQAEQIDRNSVTVLHARLLWLIAQKRFDELSQISSAYLSAKEQNPTALLAAASILAASDSMELKKEAVKLFEHAATLSPALKEARLGLASTLYQTGDADRAVTVYQELLREYPNEIQALNDLAWILQEHDRRYDAALELANRGLILSPDESPGELHLLDTRGTILSNMADRLADARNDFEKLVGLSAPDTRQKADALLKLGRICAKLNDLARARQHLQEALEIDRKIGAFTPDERAEITNILQKSGIQAVDK
jgi:tetratricopeptide (TPR) repeat protein